ncbi:MAG: trehalose-6-phosphate synthase, partial [Desulfovibrionaceae bacterium]|nr:trehalose-6-phosphate synthase [Desulfovibrionaceae bacterium]
KSMGVKRNTGFFLHIPFPAPDIFLKLPWRWKLIQALLDFDLLGFQTMRDRQNFILCARALAPECRVKGRGAVVTVGIGQREARAGSFPISIDFDDFAGTAAGDKVAAMSLDIREALRQRTLILGVDRLDYTKGIPERLRSIRTTFKRYPDLKGRMTFIQILVPSREAVGEYQDLKTEVEQLVGRINGEFSFPGWVPVHYQYRSLPREELMAYYRAADMALVTPLRDGMNLVAKEYCACNVSGNGVLILSEFAGAAAQLQKNAYLVNPHDLEGVARAIHRTFYWDNAERARNMAGLRASIRRQDIYWWLDSFLRAGLSGDLGGFPAQRSVCFAGR